MSSNPLVADNTNRSARIIGHIELPGETKAAPAESQEPDAFLNDLAATPWTNDRLRQERDRVIAEITELQTENRWQDIIALFHPVDEKLPELTGGEMESEICLKVAFALGRAGRHDDAIHCLEQVVSHEPDNHMAHYNLAYTIQDLLFTIRTSRQPMSPRERARLVETAHTHFRKARELRPESVTFCYREGILYKEIEHNPRKAVPLFEQAIANWEKQDSQTRRQNHRQRPKYIKALYHLASCHLQCGRPERSRQLLEKMMTEDRDRDHMHPLFKHFALGKVLHALGRPGDALDQLETAAYRADKGQATDFVHELAARCALALGQPERAAGYIDRIPASHRRPYVRWTEADVLIAQGRKKEALRVLTQAAERDRRARHKALLRMARIHLGSGRSDKALDLSRQASEFCRETFGNPSQEAMFWQAAALYRLGRPREALVIIGELEEHRFRYPHLRKLAALVRQQSGQTTTSSNGTRDFKLVR